MAGQVTEDILVRVRGESRGGSWGNGACKELDRSHSKEGK